jgi:hypothetical protein
MEQGFPLASPQNLNALTLQMPPLIIINSKIISIFAKKTSS